MGTMSGPLHVFDFLEKAKNAITKNNRKIGGSSFIEKYNFAVSDRRLVKFSIMDL